MEACGKVGGADHEQIRCESQTLAVVINFFIDRFIETISQLPGIFDVVEEFGVIILSAGEKVAACQNQTQDYEK